MAGAPLASPGIGSGLDVNAIVEKLMALERRPLVALAAQQAAFQSKVSAFGVLKGALSALQTAIAGLSSAALGTMAGELSDKSLASVATGAGASAGTHTIEVFTLAQSHRVASDGFASAADAVGTGTLTFRFGTWSGGAFTANGAAPIATVAIGAGTSSLAGIRDAVNAAKIGVTASIVDDGSAAGKRLVFTSASGAAMSLKIDVGDDDGNALDAAGLSRLAYDPAGSAGAGRNMTQKVAAQDATLRVDGIDIAKPTNVVADALEGVTLTLAKTNAGAPATLTLAAGASGARSAMEAFVKAYNDVQRTIATFTRYDADSRRGSVLTGDAATRGIQAQLRALLGGTVAGASGAVGELASLVQVGVKTAADGTIAFDAAKLDALLASDAAGVARLFGALGTPGDALVRYVASSAKTGTGEHAVAVTQLATRGTLAGSAPAGLTVTAGVNDTLTATIDGTPVTVTLAATTYADASALAAEIAGKLNGTTALRDAGASVSVTASGGTLTITSSRYGSSSSVALAGTAASTLVGAAPLATAGTDVAGTIGGVAATGAGRFLTGASGSAAEGLRLEILGGATGARGSVRFTRGIGAQLDALLTQLVGTSGPVAAKAEGVQASIRALDKRKAELEARLERVETSLRRQYTALDATIATMSAQSAYLAQQLANLPKIGD